MNSLIARIGFLVGIVTAAPSEYWSHTSPAVRHARKHVEKEERTAAYQGRDRRLRLLSSQSNSSKWKKFQDLGCGQPSDEKLLGTMWWTAYDCSLASRDLTYVYVDEDENPHVHTVKKGEPVKMHCDNWECPIPPVPNCYLDRDVCDNATEWCMVETHEKWGQWAMGQNGATPEFGVEERCGQHYDDLINKSAEELNLDASKVDELRSSRNAICNSTRVGVTAGMQLTDDLVNSSGYRTWMPSRGKCVKYRQEGQSCIQTQSRTGSFKGTFIRRASVVGGKFAGGGSMDRPLACAPGLVCTGPDFEVMPSTCVKERPANLCYAGPWWDSSRCPRTQVEWYDTQAGMNRSWAIEALRSSLILYPGEVDHASSCTFWQSPHVAAARDSMYEIIGALWPSHLLGPYPSKKAVEDNLWKVGDINLLELTTEYCHQESDNDDKKHSPVSKALATAGKWASRPNLLWSLIHFVMHNQPAPMPRMAVEASQALATHLSENFWCNDCRGFFTIGILSAYGMPPDVADGEAHARYWNLGHNVASEHVATTRGGHPWIVSFDEANATGVGNPFYVPYETSVKMWRVDLSEPDLRFYDVKNPKASHNDVHL